MVTIGIPTKCEKMKLGNLARSSSSSSEINGGINPGILCKSLNHTAFIITTP